MRRRVYFNSSILIRAVNPRESGHYEAMRFIEGLAGRGFTLIVSSVHGLERFKPDTMVMLLGLMMDHGFKYCPVNVRLVRDEAEEYLDRYRISSSRLLDVMHMVAAKACRCKYIAAVDRFIRTHAEEFGLKYINYYTGIP